MEGYGSVAAQERGAATPAIAGGPAAAVRFAAVTLCTRRDRGG